MANYYTQFCEEIDNITPEERAWVEKELSSPIERDEYDTDDDAAAEAFLEQWLKEHPLSDPDNAEFWPDFEFDFEGNTLVLSSDEYGNLENVEIFVQRFLAQWRPSEVFTLTWSASCSRLRSGVNGGGFLAVSATEVQSGDAWGGAKAAAEALAKGEART